jgi:6,7-dimethyl-8-ribityllumazine synthase
VGERGKVGSHDASGLRVAVVASRYNEDISERLLDGAVDALGRMGCQGDRLTVWWVPGAMELPLAAVRLARTHDAVVCVGCVIKGETAHFEHVAGQSAAGIRQAALETGKPVAFGVLTTYDREQALARSGADDNKGAEAAETAVEMANLLREPP